MVEFLTDSLESADHIWVVTKSHKNIAIDSKKILQQILGHYIPKHAIEIKRTTYGKPYVMPVDEIALSFSVSHSKDVWAAIISLDGSVGIDVEHVKKRKFLQEIARRYFSTSEHNQNLDGYYRSWTAREAFVKAIGTGLMKNIAQIDIVFEGNDMIIEHAKTLAYRVCFFEPAKDFVGAICRDKNSMKKMTYYFRSLAL
jgi:phosphopantetheinyl transferase